MSTPAKAFRPALIGWPTEQCQLWSDAIIHQIHMRVLNHIRTLAEQDIAKES